MDIYCDACTNHTLPHNHLNWQFVFFLQFTIMIHEYDSIET